MTIDEKEINSIFDSHDKKILDAKKKAKEEHEKFLAGNNKAIQIGKEIVLPSIMKIDQKLKSHDLESKIKDELKPDSYSPSITLEVVQKDPFSISKLAFRISAIEDVVEIIPEELTGTNRPSRNNNKKLKRSELTQEIVDRELVSFLRDIL